MVARLLPLIGYILTIVLANALIALFGVIPVGFGLMAPAGVFAAGLAFTMRDAVQETLGRRWAVAAILIGAGISAWFGAQLAVASGVAFLFSELADFAVYTPLRRKSWAWAVVASNIVGALIDSALFLWLAFGSLDFFAGQVLGKVWMIAPAVALWWRLRRWRSASVAPGRASVAERSGNEARDGNDAESAAGF